MDKEKLKSDILNAVEEYVDKPEAWEEAQLILDPSTGNVDIVEIEEADELPDSIDVFAMMDLVEMTPDGRWIPDLSAIEEIVRE